MSLFRRREPLHERLAREGGLTEGEPYDTTPLIIDKTTKENEKTKKVTEEFSIVSKPAPFTDYKVGIKPGSSLGWPFAVNVTPGLPLEPGGLYEWRFTIDGKAEDGWTLPFSTIEMPLAA